MKLFIPFRFMFTAFSLFLNGMILFLIHVKVSFFIGLFGICCSSKFVSDFFHNYVRERVILRQTYCTHNHCWWRKVAMIANFRLHFTCLFLFYFFEVSSLSHSRITIYIKLYTCLSIIWPVIKLNLHAITVCM